MEEEAQKQGAKIVSLRNELRELQINMDKNQQADKEATMKQALRLAKANLSKEIGMIKLKNKALNKRIESLKDGIKYLPKIRDNGEVEAFKIENNIFKMKLTTLESQHGSSDVSKAEISVLKGFLVGLAHYHLLNLLELSNSDDPNKTVQSDCD
eukprot:6286764-Ditylum_brightwellii.AAC.2